jgi:1-deoxy-D-xylulose-5-phosphate synthase
MSRVLDGLTNLPNSLKGLDSSQLVTLADEVRDVLIKKLAEVGGHVGPNLGIIEATVALHAVFDSPQDKLIWDVSHQSLPHKILTGRLDLIEKFHAEGGASAFTNIDESAHDHFNMGHTSTSVSLAAGLAKSRDIAGRHENVIAIIGDGSLSGGEAFEGLNVGATLQSNFIVLLNDNEMSIDPNSGGLYKGLAHLRETGGNSTNNIFKFMGYDYLYVEKGNDVNELVKAFKKVKDIDHPIVVHIHTLKGKGLVWAEQNPELWHYHTPFNLKTGESTSARVDKKRPLIVNSIDTTVNYLLNKQDAIVVIPGSPLLGRKLQETIPERYFDMGIAEQTGVAFASGVAKGGVKAYMVIASTFVQRAYDQVIQDWTLNNTPATLIVVGSGITASDSAHVGTYDIPMLSNIPNLVYLTPTSEREYLKMLEWTAVQDFPTAIRISGGAIGRVEDREVPEIEGYYSADGATAGAGSAGASADGAQTPVRANTISGGVLPKQEFIAKSEVYQRGSQVALLGLGLFFQKALEVAQELEKTAGIRATVINPRYITHLDQELLESLLDDHHTVVTLEDGVVEGGFGQKVATFFAQRSGNGKAVRCLVRGGAREHTDSVSYGELMARYRLNTEQIVEDVLAR